MDIVGKVKEDALLPKGISLGLSFLIFVSLDLCLMVRAFFFHV